jgi:hypothetical protein
MDFPNDNADDEVPKLLLQQQPKQYRSVNASASHARQQKKELTVTRLNGNEGRGCSMSLAPMYW